MLRLFADVKALLPSAGALRDVYDVELGLLAGALLLR